MNAINLFNDVNPENALRDPRIISRAIYDDPHARDGKHYLILKDDQHLIFAIAYQHNNKNINPTGERWSGGTQIEIPGPAFIWLLNSIEMHRQQIINHDDAHRADADAKRPTEAALIKTPAVKFRDEKLSLSRIVAGEPGYALKNHSRHVHLPWANANWHQKLELTDHVLFEQGYWGVLKKLAAPLRPIQVVAVHKQAEPAAL
ncbi:MAG TPA: hypothetical protein PK129_04350 [Cellvibrionaceae bacterium]|nr:hypothetical protein [Cellvibrionaceae bacterium]